LALAASTSWYTSVRSFVSVHRAMLGDLMEPALPSGQPTTRYARSDGLDIAYQVFGDGPIDLVFAGGWVTHLEYAWRQPRVADFYRRLARFSRLILFDKRGTGLSERLAVDRPPTLDERMDDLRVVMDATGSEQAALFGVSEGGAMSMLFAATYPERTRALILLGTYARRVAGPGYSLGPSADEWGRFIDSLEDQWGGPVALEMVAPSVAHDPTVADWWSTYLRLGATPRTGAELLRMNAQIDVRPILPAIRAPTLVLHRRGDRAFPPESGRFIADHIPDARFLELDGEDHQFWAGDTEPILGAVEEFLTGTRRAPPSRRILTTLLFTDLVGSTRRLAEIGDAAWRSLLESHHAAVRAVLEQYGGIEVDTTGDGFLARFDGPGRAVLAATTIRGELTRMGLEVRMGIHTGEVEVAAAELRGIAVHLAARVMAEAASGEILVTRTVRDLVAGSGIHFADRGLHPLKGVPGQWELAAVSSAPG
jgi:pimeloyl-ACP methyl ester carboxylesterase